MAIFHSNAIPAGSTGYEIEYSCRFNDDSNHYMERTPSSDGNRTTWTVSFWCKRGTLHDVVPSNQYIIFGANNNDARICFTEDDNGDGVRVVETGRFELITKTKKENINGILLEHRTNPVVTICFFNFLKLTLISHLKQKDLTIKNR